MTSHTLTNESPHLYSHFDIYMTKSPMLLSTFIRVTSRPNLIRQRRSCQRHHTMCLLKHKKNSIAYSLWFHLTANYQKKTVVLFCCTSRDYWHSTSLRPTLHKQTWYCITRLLTVSPLISMWSISILFVKRYWPLSGWLLSGSKNTHNLSWTCQMVSAVCKKLLISEQMIRLMIQSLAYVSQYS